MAEPVPLGGGQMNEVYLESGPDGDVVRRNGGPWTPSVHRYLSYLHRAGIDWVPRALSFDGVHERLTYLPGVVPAYPLPSWVWREEVLVDGARRLRALHDASTGFSADGATWQSTTKIPAEVMCVNDFSPHNLVFDTPGDAARIVGLIDLDFCSPGPRLWDLAYFATRLVPLTGETPAGAPAPDDVLRRMQLLLDGYGGSFTVPDVLRMAIIRLWDLAEFADAKSAELGKPELREDAEYYRREATFLTAWRTGPAPAG